MSEEPEEKRKKREIVFDKKFEKGEFVDVIGIGAIKSGDRIDCVHISFGQLRPDRKEEKENEIIEHCEPISNIIMSESATRLLLDKLHEIFGVKEGGD